MISRRIGATGRRAVAVLVFGLVACASVGPVPAPAGSSIRVEPRTALAFHDRVTLFYDRLLLRRFNTLETFNDPLLRDYFGSLDHFFDYYADLAQAFADANFEKSRPTEVEVQEFLFEDPRHAVVQVRFGGLDDRPLRPGRSAFVRWDRWERVDGDWWVVPSRL